MGQEAIRQIGCYAQNTRVLANQNFTTTPLAHPVGFGRDTHKHLQQYLVVGGSKVSEFHGFGKSALQQNSVKYSSRSTTILVRASESRNLEIRVCSNKACRKSGSIQTLDVIKSLAPANVSVESCGCLGELPNSWRRSSFTVFSVLLFHPSQACGCRKMWERSQPCHTSCRTDGQPLQHGSSCSTSAGCPVRGCESRKQPRCLGPQRASQQSVRTWERSTS